MRGSARTYLIGLAAGGCLCLGAGTASAGTPAIACGSTLTKSTTLTADLLNCPGTALVIGADGITVNLGGHTISGTNAKGSEGIANDGHARVRVLGSGKITDFRLNGVGMRKAPKSVVRGLTIRRIGAGGVEGEPVSAGIAIVDSPGSQVTSNDVANDVKAYQSDGADVLNSPGSVVRGNTLSHNAWNGLALIDSAGSRIAGNKFDDNGNNGTEVNGKSDTTSVTSNGADGNKAIGIVVGAVRNVRVVGNSANGNDTGLFFFDLHTSVIAKNSGKGNRIGIQLTGGQFGSSDNRLTGNTANRNDESGIIVDDDKPENLSKITLKGNTANKNQIHGIEGLAGVVDGGGNRASGNATPPQCIGVVCSG
jgi:parallel beta-helix repeat protein